MAEKCTNTSSPVERWINPYPFAPLNHFTVPFSLSQRNSFRLLRIILPPLVCLPCPGTQDTATGHPLKGTVRILAGVAARRPTAQTETAPLHSGGRLPATKYGGAAKTKARYRTADTETS